MLPRRSFGEHVEEELVQHSFAAPFVDQEWLHAVLLRFDAVVRLVGLEMEQVFCEDILYHMIYNIC